MIRLAGDLGGTKTILKLFETGGRVLREELYASTDYSSFDEILASFLDAGSRVDGACFAVAGPVVDQQARITNLPWILDAGEIERKHSIDRVWLVNDFYGVAASLPLLTADDSLTLNPGDPDPRGPRAVIGAGTGLGQAIVAAAGDTWIILPTEGGHADFAPANDVQDALLLHLRARYGHVSWERVVSGIGIREVYEFMAELHGVPPTPGDAADVDRLAESGDTVAGATMDLFVEAYGAEAGNLALKTLPRGGLFIAGGIAARNLDRMTDGRFLESFLAKGRFRNILERIPVHLLTNERAGLIGATRLAATLSPASQPTRPPE